MIQLNETLLNGLIVFVLARAAYIAMGLSTDRLMGDDLVIECVNEGGSGNIKAYTSLTFKGNTFAGANRSKIV